jgi:hypothetical protein
MQRIGSLIVIGLILGIITTGFSQSSRKQVKANRTVMPPEINGYLDDAVWQKAEPATGFIQYEPYNGRIATLQTEVRFLYDDIAIYIGAMMFDPNPDSILTELGFRDADNLNADYISFDFIPFNDGINAASFGVSASGVQYDIKLFEDAGDESWDAVWRSEVAIVENGWSAELMIPYSALRFPKETGGNWGINIWRNLRRKREISSWNFVDKEIAGKTRQSGELTGLENITPPLRLSFTPYVSGYVEKSAADPDRGYYLNYGLDVKFGISESFTLDMTLIPDFGQVQSDDEVFNLTPFEVYFDEKRPFFTEGTELFEKGNVFYSRRIGAKPDNHHLVEDSLLPGEAIIENPSRTNLINASKLSGRTNKGLGIGVFNAMSSATFATLKDSLGNKRKIETQPFSNYNMFVLDQNLRNNSYLSFYNTNVFKGSDHYIANVSGTQFQLFNKASSYAFYGRFNLSQKYFPQSPNETGFTYIARLIKTSGRFRFSVTQYVEDDKYDPNDLGFLQANNEISNSLQLSYNIHKPFWKLLRLNNSVQTWYTTQYRPRNFVDFGFYSNTWATFRSHLTVGLNFYFNPVDEFDYYEARTPGRAFIRPPEWSAGLMLSPDYRKKLIVDFDVDFELLKQFNHTSISTEISPRWRVSDQLTFRQILDVMIQNNDYGFVEKINDEQPQEIIFGGRDLQTIENIFQATFIFSSRMAFDFRLRHYWMKAIYNQYFRLDNDGYLLDSDYADNNDFNFNAFNIDMIIRWEFAQGSELVIAWKNAILTLKEGEVVHRYFDNLRNTFDSPADNSLSVKVLYYIDYMSFKRRKSH